MITEQEAREAAGEWRPDAMESVARSATMNSRSTMLVAWAVQELSRREAEQAERAKPIDDEWLESLENWTRTGDYISTRIKGNDVWYHIADACIGFGGLRQGHITTRGQLLDLIAALKGGVT